MRLPALRGETPAGAKASPDAGHQWRFHRFGGVDQVVFRDAGDLLRLPELDLKLWMALSVPTTGIELDPQTAALVDADGDARIHPQDVIEALRWTCERLHDPERVLRGEDRLPLDAIRDPVVAAGARHVLAGLGRADAADIALADVADRARIFARLRFNGDGVITPGTAGDDTEAADLIQAVVDTVGGVPDRGGSQGLDLARLQAFRDQARAVLEWSARAQDPSNAPLGPAATARAAAAIRAVREKVEDYFARCRLAAFDSRSRDLMNRDTADYRAIAAGLLTADTPAVAEFPLAAVEAGRPLPLLSGCNPAWSRHLRRLSEDAVTPLLGEAGEALSEADWQHLTERIAPYEAYQAQRPAYPVASLGTERLQALLLPATHERVEALLRQDAAMAPESAQIATVEKLLRLARDLRELLTNSVNFADFYGKTNAVFQVGTLYIDGRACSLCVDVIDDARHASMAGLSGLFLVYCDLSRTGGLKRRIAAAITDGDCDNIMVGRNGLFRDRRGALWDATVTRVVSAPISVRQAFWQPYKKLVRMIEDQIAKRAQAADEASTAKLSAGVESVVAAETPPPASGSPAAAPKKIELGTIALIGTAIGGISALVAGFLKALFGLGLWLPVGVVGVILFISGPSMILAAVKLRRRNLAPLLDANGWAINTQARINIPFGGTLTRLASLPPGTVPSLYDPFAEKRRRWPWLLIAAAALALSIAWAAGALDRCLPHRLKRHGSPSDSALSADPPSLSPDGAVSSDPHPTEGAP